jgi:hypothetical protein
MRRIFESWWWVTLAVIGFIIYGGTFPSDPVVEPGRPILAYTALVISTMMLLLSIASSAWRLRRRAH